MHGVLFFQALCIHGKWTKMLIPNLLCKQWRYLHRFARLSRHGWIQPLNTMYRVTGFPKQSVPIVLLNFFPISFLHFLNSAYFSSNVYYSYFILSWFPQYDKHKQTDIQSWNVSKRLRLTQNTVSRSRWHWIIMRGLSSNQLDIGKKKTRFEYSPF